MHNHTCLSCHSILEKLASLTPATLPKFIVNLKSSLSESTKKSTTTSSSPSSTKPLQQNEHQVQRGNTTHVAPQITPDSPMSHVRQESRSPSTGLSPNPRKMIQLAKTNSKNRFSVLGG